MVLDAKDGAVVSVRDLHRSLRHRAGQRRFLASTGTGEIVQPEGSAHSGSALCLGQSIMLRIRGVAMITA